MAGQVFALLVGIDRYANPYEAPHLRGCVADVEGTYSLLVTRFGLAPAQIRVLTARLGEQEDPAALPTRANIIAGWREHLGQAGAGDVVFFHYSGHGSQSRSVDPNEPDGYDETIVPHDSRTPGVYDLADKELADLIRRVESRGAQVIVFLDCCHAGSGTRGLEQGAEQARVRRCRPDERVRPPSAYLDGLRLRRRPSRPSAPSGWLPQGKHVLLAACRDDELSYEYRAPGTQQWHGVASYFFQRTLAAADTSITWAQIHDRVLAQVHAIYPAQSPQLEGPSHLTLFGEVGEPIRPYLLVLAVEGDEYIQVNGGAAVGLTPGSRLAVYAPGADLSDAPVAAALVEEIAVDHAWAKLDRITPLEPGARVKVAAVGLLEAPYGVLTDDAILRNALTALGAGELAGFLQPVGSKEESPAAFVVTVEQGCYVVRDHAGVQLWPERPPASADGAVRVAAILRHLAVYRNVQRLHNPAPPQGVHGKIELETVAYYRAGRGRNNDDAKLYDAGHSAVVGAGQKLQLTIHNHSDEAVYLAVFNLDADYGITRIYPPHAVNQKVAPGGNVVIDPIVPQLRGPYRGRAVETIKVIATRVATSFDVLQLPKLGDGNPEAGVRADATSALGQLLNAVRRQGMRDLVLELDDTVGGWTTTQVEVTVIAPPERHPLPRDLVRVAIEAEGGWTVEKSADWAATVLLADLVQASRGQARQGPLLPPGLSNPGAAAFFRPVCAGEATATGASSPVVMGIAAPADELAQISPDLPLRVELAVADEPNLAGVVPIAYDGARFYLAGKPVNVELAPSFTGGVRRLACDIHLLPPASDGGTTRDLRRAARLFFYKIFTGALPADTGLRIARLEDGQVTYGPVTKEAIAQAERVALLLHGFTGESRGLVEKVWPWVKPLGDYDLCLTYDYETFGTGLREQGEKLAATLLGFGMGEAGQPRLDVYGYSSGALVARALVELCGGDAFVDRVFMGGPPNAGTPLAKSGSLIPWLANIGINLAGAVPAALIAHWLLEQASDAGQGLNDLAPDSDFIAEINAAWRPPALAPYYVQIGDNSRAFGEWHLLAQRVMQMVSGGLDLLFAGDNDLLVSVASARCLEGRWPRLETRVIGGHHFQYFHSPESRRVLAEWLAGEAEA